MAENQISLVQKLGEGGFGQVWKCYSDDNPIALKIIDTTTITASEIEWFKERIHFEIKISLKLKHKNIINTFGFKSFGKNHLLFMDLMEGSLDGLLFPEIPEEYKTDSEKDDYYIKNTLWGILGPEQFTHLWGKQILEAIDFIHSKGVSHMDIKPSNILYSGQSPTNMRFVLTDWYIDRT